MSLTIITQRTDEFLYHFIMHKTTLVGLKKIINYLFRGKARSCIKSVRVLIHDRIYQNVAESLQLSTILLKIIFILDDK